MKRNRLGARLAAVAMLVGVLGCAPSESEVPSKYSLIMGIDVSGSFRRQYDDAITFAAYYIYGHLNGLHGLRVPTSLFVSEVGGQRPDEVKSFHPIHEFQGKGVEEIAAQLREWFPQGDKFTDFNVFFERVSDLVKRQGLVLTPLNVVILSDGIPDVARPTADTLAKYANIDLAPLEFLSRSTTVRLLYPTPSVAVLWERKVQRRRVRLWTLDGQVMAGWQGQMSPGVPLSAQDRLWTWVNDNVDFRVRSSIL